MSNKAINWAWDVPVNGNRKLVLIALADHVNKNNTCWPGLDRLAQMCGISRSSIIHHVKELIKLGIISKKARYDDEGHRTSNLYQLNIALSPELLRSKTLSSDLPSLSTDLPPDYVQNLDPNHKEPLEEPKGKASTSSIVKNIFQHWQKILDHPRAKLDGKRKATINKALELGYSEDDLKTAIEGCAKTPYNMGENDSHQRYDSITLILRDAEHIERYMQNCKNPPKSKSMSVDKEPWAGAI